MEIENKVVLMYVLNGQLCPVALTPEQDTILQMTAGLFSPITVIKDQPLGKAIDLIQEKKKSNAATLDPKEI